MRRVPFGSFRVVSLMLVLLAGCGQRGPLTLPSSAGPASQRLPSATGAMSTPSAEAAAPPASPPPAETPAPPASAAPEQQTDSEDDERTDER
jgi:predicted small lipoprotein YifL